MKIESSKRFTSEAVKVISPKVHLLFESLYFTITSCSSVGIFVNLILLPLLSPCVEDVDTVTTFLESSPTIEEFKVVKLWLFPDPKSLKKRSPAAFPVPIPTYSPLVPRPTLTVEIPIRLLSNAVAYKFCVCGRAKFIFPLDTVISDPPWVEYLILSPVLTLCSGI